MLEPLDPTEATRLLDRIREGDADAANELVHLLYDELKEVAAYCMDRQPADHTLQPTALVHEVWVRIARGQGRSGWENRAHFLRMSARTMRHVLVDHARAKRAAKRGDGARQLPLDALIAGFDENAIDVLDLNDALERLATVDEELTRIVELRFFAGLTVPEVAEVLAVSERTVHRGWKVARVWLRDTLPAPGDSAPDAPPSGDPLSRDPEPDAGC